MQDSTQNGQANRTPRGRRVMVLAALAGLAAAPTLFAADTVTFTEPRNTIQRRCRRRDDAFERIPFRRGDSSSQRRPDHLDRSSSFRRWRTGEAARPDRNRIPEQFRDLLPERPHAAPDPNRRQPDRMGQGTGVIATDRRLW